jgi:hypothetical protein
MKYWLQYIFLIVVLIAPSQWTLAYGNEPHTEPVKRVPVIYSTDLFHAADDPDDHFDLATLFAIPELDIKGVILEQGAKQLQRPGGVAVAQLNKITGRNVPFAIGLSHPLNSARDKGLDQKEEFQKGVELILSTLRDATSPVMIAFVGSARDVVAAYNREPELFKAKVGKVLAHIGEASNPNFMEWNVHLDPYAFEGLMTSDLPIYWVPAFDGGVYANGGHASWWITTHRDLLRGASSEVLQYFIYALEVEKSDPLAFLSSAVDPIRKERLFAGKQDASIVASSHDGKRNMWCPPGFTILSGRRIVFDGKKYTSLPPTIDSVRDKTHANDLFAFSEVELSVTRYGYGVVSYGKNDRSRKVMRFQVRDMINYSEGMTSVTADLLSTLGRRKP